jgi:Cu(I)/Ag(I) efflux system membrane fusion protein
MPGFPARRGSGRRRRLRPPTGQIGSGDGAVIRKDIHEDQYVAEGTALFEIADLGRVWVEASAFEGQLGRIEVGRPAEAIVPAFSGEAFAGRIALIAPALDPGTRTIAVRVELDNLGHRIRPGMFATVTLDVPQGRRSPREPTICPVSRRRLGSMGPAVRAQVEARTVWVCCAGCISRLKSAPILDPETPTGDRVLSVPESAVIDTGGRTVVYVEIEPGVYEGREVVLGTWVGDVFPVLEGLAAGEKVAARGAFLIDAESRINPAVRRREPGDDHPPRGGEPLSRAGVATADHRR